MTHSNAPPQKSSSMFPGGTLLEKTDPNSCSHRDIFNGTVVPFLAPSRVSRQNDQLNASARRYPDIAARSKRPDSILVRCIILIPFISDLCVRALSH